MIQSQTKLKKEHSLISSPNSTSKNKQAVQFKDNRPESTTQLKVQQMANNAVVDAPIQRRTNKTGMPDSLKSGIENLSGLDMSDVKVHYNSPQPAQLQAHAFAQGNQIHLGPGQERHLPHEAWHVVQQKQGRVAPTKQLKGKVNINDDSGLEKEADVMGAKAHNQLTASTTKLDVKNISSSNSIQRMRKYNPMRGANNTVVRHAWYQPYLPQIYFFYNQMRHFGVNNLFNFLTPQPNQFQHQRAPQVRQIPVRTHAGVTGGEATATTNHQAMTEAFSKEEKQKIRADLNKFNTGEEIDPKYSINTWNRITTMLPFVKNGVTGLHAQQGLEARSMNPLEHQTGATGAFLGSASGTDIAPEVFGATGQNNGVLIDEKGNAFMLQYIWHGEALDVNKTNPRGEEDRFGSEREGVRTRILLNEIHLIYKRPVVEMPLTDGRPKWGATTEKQNITDQVKGAIKQLGGENPHFTQDDILRKLGWRKGS